MAKQAHSSTTNKFVIRRKVAAKLGEPVQLLETHGGLGECARHWGVLARHVAFDVDPTMPMLNHCRAEVGIQDPRLDVSGFNAFDVDAYGDPWHWVWLISQRVAPLSRRIAVVTTNGNLRGPARMHPNLKSAGWSMQMIEASGLKVSTPAKDACARPDDWYRRILSAWFGGVVTWVASTDAAGSAGCFYHAAIIDPRGGDSRHE